jgi:hypothetical protein
MAEYPVEYNGTIATGGDSLHLLATKAPPATPKRYTTYTIEDVQVIMKGVTTSCEYHSIATAFQLPITPTIQLA